MCPGRIAGDGVSFALCCGLVVHVFEKFLSLVKVTAIGLSFSRRISYHRL